MLDQAKIEREVDLRAGTMERKERESTSSFLSFGTQFRALPLLPAPSPGSRTASHSLDLTLIEMGNMSFLTHHFSLPHLNLSMNVRDLALGKREMRVREREFLR